MQKRFEEESRAKAAATDSLISADRRANANQNALEEARTLLEQADRNRKYSIHVLIQDTIHKTKSFNQIMCLLNLTHFRPHDRARAG